MIWPGACLGNFRTDFPHLIRKTWGADIHRESDDRRRLGRCAASP